jgi:outer membrane protein
MDRRNILFAFTLAFMSLSAMAQRTAGTMAIGGGFNVRSTKTEAGTNNTVTTTNFSLVPQVGYFVSDNLALGLELSLSNSSSESGNQTNKGSSYQIGPAVRYYKEIANSQLTVFGQGGVYFGGGSNELTVGNITSESKSSSFGIYVAPGLAYFFNEHWAGELYFNGIGYSATDPNKDNNADKSTTVFFGVNSLAPSGLGIRYHF